MNMWQEHYHKELLRQIVNTAKEINVLIQDYKTVNDDICRSQIKTFLEKKEHILLQLLKEVNYGSIKQES